MFNFNNLSNSNVLFKYIFLLLCCLDTVVLLHAQHNIEWPYGGSFDKERSYQYLTQTPLKFPESVEFDTLNFQKVAHFQDAIFEKSVSFDLTEFSKAADFYNSNFKEDVNFLHTQFHSDVSFNDVKFFNTADFFHVKFMGKTKFRFGYLSNVKFRGCKFYKKVDFSAAKFPYSASFVASLFSENVDFGGTNFEDRTNFMRVDFKGEVNFDQAIFHNEAIFLKAEFHNTVNFYKTDFLKIADFQSVKFNNNVNFVDSKFGKILILAGTKFEKGVDFKQSNFDKVTDVYIDYYTTFPPGKLFIDWAQIKADKELRIKFFNPSLIYNNNDSSQNKTIMNLFEEQGNFPTYERDSLTKKSTQQNPQNFITRKIRVYDSKIEVTKEEHFLNIETFYHRLKDNFLIQGNNSSADDVMFELGRQRDEILDELWWSIYGHLFGYGYQPWKFIVFIVVPIIIIFAYIWYWFYYPMLIYVNESMYPTEYQKAKSLRQRNIYFTKPHKSWLLKFKIIDFSNIYETTNRFNRYWHCIYFSAAVLLGIRFKKEWIKESDSCIPGYKTFIYMVTLQWLLGIGLIITFILLVKGVRFSFIRDLLGF